MRKTRGFSWFFVFVYLNDDCLKFFTLLKLSSKDIRNHVPLNRLNPVLKLNAQ